MSGDGNARRAVALGAVAAAALAVTSVTARAQTLVARLHCGGPQVTLANGEVWAADHAYGAPPSTGYVGGAPVTVISGHDGAEVGGYKNVDSKLHATGREGWQAYRFDVASGNYIVRLHMAELLLAGPQLRVFDVLAEGAPLLAQLDIAARHGVQYGAVFTALVSVSDGRLDIEAAGPDPALLSGIEVWTAPANQGVPPVVANLVARGTYRRNVLTWQPAPGPLIAGYRVWRADAPGGPFTLLGTTWTTPTRWLDDDVQAGQARYYRVSAVNAAGTEGTAGAVASATPLDSAASTLPVYSLTITPENLALIDAAVITDPDLTVPAVFAFDGQTWNVTVRYRGASTRVYSKQSWKVKFPDDHRFHGQTDLNLKAHFVDASLLREPLSIGLFHAVGHPAPERAPVHLEVNGIYRGEFDGVEQIEVEYLKARDRDPGGNVYEVDGDFSKLADAAAYEEHYEKKTNKGTGNDDLVALIELVNDTSDAEFANALASVFDVDGLLSYFAVIGFIADEDSVRHNGYLLHDLALGRWEFIAWDNESSWAANAQGAGAALPVDFGTAGASVPFNVLKTRVLGVPAFRWLYAEKLAALAAGEASASTLAPQITAAHAQILVDASADIFKFGWESNLPFNVSAAALLQFAQARGTFLATALPQYQPPLPPTTVWINEFMADNTSTLADETGDFDDWIELWNADGAPADVGGLYLTSDLSAPTRWQIPAGTTIPGFGHLLVWADAEPGPLHANFQLPAEGGAIGLFAADGVTLLDVHHFRPQLPDVSEGRVPDGAPFLRALPSPTPGSANSGAGNLPPLVTWVEHDPVLVQQGDDVAVTALVTDADGLQSVTLHASIGGGPFTDLPMVAIGANRYEADVSPLPLGTSVHYWIEARDALGKAGAKPTHAPAETFSWTVGAGEPIGVRIAEVMAENTITATDEAGDHEDWVELVSTTDVAVDLSGFHLTDNFANPGTWTFPAGTVIPPHGRLLVWADSEPAEGPLHATFKLSKSGEAVGLFHPDGVTFVDGFSFGPQKADVSFGRMPDGADVLVELLDPSPGASNVPPDGAHARFDLGNLAAGGPALAGNGRAQVGGTASWALTSAPPGANGLLLIGVQTLVAPTLAKGTLLLQPLVMLPLSFDAAGGASVVLPVPADPILDHVVVDLQAFAAGARLGNALASTLAP